jgi:hypothetical protein
MAKNQATHRTHRTSAVRDRSSLSGKFVERDTDKRPFKGTRREILFPTEPTSIPHEKIDRAIDLVMSRKK